MSAVEKPNRFAAKVKQAEPANTKSLRIKTNALKRTIKDLEFAKKEVIREAERLEGIKMNNPDRISQQENVLNEAKMMVPHAENRIRSGAKDLRECIEKESGNINDEELMIEATTVLNECDEAIGQ